jgi:hypothetical protein
MGGMGEGESMINDDGNSPKVDWRDDLDEREVQEINLAMKYYGGFNHGTVGHLGYVTLAKLAHKLDRVYQTGEIE